jgi:hypothetical protein
MSAETCDPIEGEATEQLKLDMATLLNQCKFHAKRSKLNRPSRNLEIPDMGLLSKGKNFADRMALLYMSRFESALRILHVPSFWREYEYYWAEPAHATVVLCFKIELVIALGASLHGDASDSNGLYSAAPQSLHNAQMWLAGPVEKNRLSIDALQVHCLLLLARPSTFMWWRSDLGIIRKYASYCHAVGPASRPKTLQQYDCAVSRPNISFYTQKRSW